MNSIATNLSYATRLHSRPSVGTDREPCPASSGRLDALDCDQAQIQVANSFDDAVKRGLVCKIARENGFGGVAVGRRHLHPLKPFAPRFVQSGFETNFVQLRFVCIHADECNRKPRSLSAH